MTKKIKILEIIMPRVDIHVKESKINYISVDDLSLQLNCKKR
jgi:hypothetical protein